MLLVAVIGTAGSGKSTLVWRLSEYMRDQDEPVLTINLDPAAEYLPYTPDIDIREYVYARELMEKYKLGPNGAVIAAADLILNYVNELNDGLSGFEDGYVIMDTPGQMEVFAFRRSGTELINGLLADRKALIFVHDSVLSLSPSAFISQVFLAQSVFYRFKLPMINAFNKVDMLSREEQERILTWITNPDTLVTDLNEEMIEDGAARVSLEMLKVLGDFFEMFSCFPVSAKTLEGVPELYAGLQRIYTGGNKIDVGHEY